MATSDEVVATAVAVCRAIGKHPVTCGDRAGFIVNALLFPYLNDAVRMLEANYASADDIDLAMKKGCGYPMGPFELLDVVGLDVSLAIQRTLYLEFREPGFAPAPRLEHLVTAGYLGRKTGRGFRVYATDGPQAPAAPGGGAGARPDLRQPHGGVPPGRRLGRAAGHGVRGRPRRTGARAATRRSRPPPRTRSRSAADDPKGVEHRRHWHTPCWAARDRRAPASRAVLT